MKKVIEHIDKQPNHIQTLISKMIDALRMDQETLYILQPKLTKDDIEWLEDNEFEPTFNESTQQWEIDLV